MANVLVKLGSLQKPNNGVVYADMKTDTPAVDGLLLNKQAIRQSIHNILSWRRGERILFPEFGNVTYEYIFENIGSEVVDKLKYDIGTMLSAEPRISVTEIRINANIDANEILITVQYWIPSLETTDSVSITISR